MLSLKLYNYLPFYAALIDECEVMKTLLDLGVQLEIDRLYKAINDREVTFDVYDSAGEEHFDWLGQLFGLIRGGKGSWVGIGLNPQWESSYKQDVILEISDYWRNKGTETGVIQAIKLWLQWSEPDVTITLPLKTRWQDYNQSLAPQLDFGLLERRRLGSGDYFPGRDYTPPWTYEGEKDVYTSQSRLAEKNIWLQLYPPTDAIWNNINTHLPRLLIEAVAIDRIATPICWWEVEVQEPLTRIEILTVSGTTYKIYPTSTINSISDDTGLLETVAGEFFVRPNQVDTIDQIALFGDGGFPTILKPDTPRVLNPDVYIGFLAPVTPPTHGTKAVFLDVDGNLTTAIAHDPLFKPNGDYETVLTGVPGAPVPDGASTRSAVIDDDGNIIAATTPQDPFQPDTAFETALDSSTLP